MLCVVLCCALTLLHAPCALQVEVKCSSIICGVGGDVAEGQTIYCIGKLIMNLKTLHFLEM